jgi:hypothetical protein
VAQAEHFFYNNGFAFALCLSAFPHLAASTGLACFCTANMNNWACWRGGAEVFIEGDHAVHFGYRNIEGVGKYVDEVAVVREGGEGVAEATAKEDVEVAAAASAEASALAASSGGGGDW